MNERTKEFYVSRYVILAQFHKRKVLINLSDECEICPGSDHMIYKSCVYIYVNYLAIIVTGMQVSMVLLKAVKLLCLYPPPCTLSVH